MDGGSGTQIIDIPQIHLAWHGWERWHAVEADARGDAGIRVPNKRPGVYEVRRDGEDVRITIGKAADLRMRVKQGLIRGKCPHSTGERIRRTEGTSRLLVRWAETSRPAAVEEELHRLHSERFGRLRLLTEHT